MHRSCKIKWNHILFLWFRFALTHLMGSHEIHSTKKDRLARFHFVPLWAKYPPYKIVFTLDIIQRAVMLQRWSAAAGSCPNKISNKKRGKKERNIIAEDKFSCQARCCEVAKVSGPRWSPCSPSLEQRIHIRGHVYLGGKQQLSGALRQRGRKRVL